MPGGAAFYHGEGGGGTHQSIDLTAAHATDQIQNRGEAPQVGKNHPVQQTGMAAQGVEHLAGRAFDVVREGICFDAGAGPGQNTHGGMRLGGGGMTAVGVGLELGIVPYQQIDTVVKFCRYGLVIPEIFQLYLIEVHGRKSSRSALRSRTGHRDRASCPAWCRFHR